MLHCLKDKEWETLNTYKFPGKRHGEPFNVDQQFMKYSGNCSQVNCCPQTDLKDVFFRSLGSAWSSSLSASIGVHWPIMGLIVGPTWGGSTHTSTSTSTCVPMSPTSTTRDNVKSIYTHTRASRAGASQNLLFNPRQLASDWTEKRPLKEKKEILSLLSLFSVPSCQWVWSDAQNKSKSMPAFWVSALRHKLTDVTTTV